MKRLPPEDAAAKAEAWLRDNGFTSLPVDLERVASILEIEVQPLKQTQPGVSGMLISHMGVFGIMFGTYVKSIGFQRFSIAHEIGHYLLEGHAEHLFPPGITSHSSQAGFTSVDPYEQEADNFAAGLLMPTKPFKKLMGRSRLGFADIEAVRDACKTSLTTTAIRYAELTDDAIAVILSTGRTIDYCILSEAMKSLPDLAWLKRGSPVPAKTTTERFNADESRVLKAERDEDDIDVLDWLGGKRSSMVTEEVVGLGRYGKTLTVLSSQKIGQEAYDDDGDDDDLIERWTPGLKK